MGKRLIIDLRYLNAVTTMTRWPIMTFESCIDAMAEQNPPPRFWASLDQKSGYYNICLDESSQEKTGFSSPDGVNWVHTRLPMGWTGSVQWFSRIMSKVLANLPQNVVCCYIDDLLVSANSEEKLLENLDLVLDRLRKAKLRLYGAKCHFGVSSVRFLGHIFDQDGIRPCPKKINLIKNMPRPSNIRDLRSQLGLFSYYKRFQFRFSQITSPLRKLLKNGVPFVWNDECEASWQRLKNNLMEAPVLGLPNFNRQFYLSTDASYTGLSYILSQKDDQGRDRAVNFGGRALHPNEKNWSVTHLECLALVEGCREYSTYLRGRKFTVLTDHVSLTFIKTMKLGDNKRLTRWSLFLQDFDFSIEHQRGKLHTAADCISRMDFSALPVPEESETKTLNLDRRAVDITFDFDNLEHPDDTGGAVASIVEPSRDEFSQKYDTCPEFADMKAYLVSGALPTDDKKARTLLLTAENFVYEDGLLYFLSKHKTGRGAESLPAKRLCVPTHFRPHVAISLHDQAGHIGINRLYDTSRHKYYFTGQYAFLKEHVLTCKTCQQVQDTGSQPAPIQSLPVVPPLMRWSLDFHGPFEESNGKKYVLTAICSTAMWPELVAVENTSAETVVRALFDNIVARYGLPNGITFLSDNGSAFISKFTQCFCDIFGIRQAFSSPGHPQTNCRAEKMATNIHKTLRVMCKEQKQWSEHLQAVAMNYRASATSNLDGYSPFEILHARPMAISFDRSLLATDPPGLPAHWIAELKPKLHILSEIAQSAVQQSARRAALRSDEKAKLPTFKVGDHKLLNNTKCRRGQSVKLQATFVGP